MPFFQSSDDKQQWNTHNHPSNITYWVCRMHCLAEFITHVHHFISAIHGLMLWIKGVQQCSMDHSQHDNNIRKIGVGFLALTALGR